MRTLLTPAEVAELLRVNINTIYRLIDTGEIQYIRIGSLYRIPSAQFGITTEKEKK